MGARREEGDAHAVEEVKRAFVKEMTFELGLEGWLGFQWECLGRGEAGRG